MLSLSARAVFALPAALAGAGLVAACTASSGAEVAATGQGARQCFLASQVNGFHAVDRDTVNVNVGVRRIYQLELFGSCQDIDWSQRIGIRSTGGSDWICQGLDAELIVPSPIGPQRCQVSSVRRLSDEEVRAWRETRRRR